MDGSSQLRTGSEELLPAPIANFRHSFRAHYVGSIRLIASFCFVLSGNLIVVSTQHPTMWSIAIGLVTFCLSIAAIIAHAIKLFRPCPCGKFSESDKLSRLPLSVRFRSLKKRPIYWILLSLPLSLAFSFFADVKLGHLPVFVSLLTSVRVAVLVSTMIFSVSMLLAVNTKWFRNRHQASLELTGTGFGERVLEDKSDEELNYLIDVALEDGLAEHADRISQFLLNKAEFRTVKID